MTRHFILLFSSPFIAIGFVWQFVAGTFLSGRMLATAWIHKVAIARMKELFKDAPPAQDKSASKGLH